MYEKRYVYDALYGPVHYPKYIWDVLSCPELQRLREVRLCNTNSLCLTGGANINRYEHSLGTAFLAIQCLTAAGEKITTRCAKHVVYAALLHDVGSTAFGHSVQYVLDPKGYHHESLSEIVTGVPADNSSYQYQHAKMEPIFFGMPKRLEYLLDQTELRCVADIVEGHGQYGCLINGSMDLDNIDNVYRLSYHIGLVRSGENALKLARHIWVSDGQLMVDDDAVDLMHDWYDLRRDLYRILLLNPDEFSAKAMLEDALLMADRRAITPFFWHDVDYEIIEKLLSSSSDVANVVSRLMIGDLYGCIGLYTTSELSCYKDIAKPARRAQLENALSNVLRDLGPRFRSASISIHAIEDINKTERQIQYVNARGRRVTMGHPSSRVLIGLFCRNKHLSMARIRPSILEEHRVVARIGAVLQEQLDLADLRGLGLYEEIG